MNKGPIHLPIRDAAVRQAWRDCARHTLLVAGAFVVCIGVIMLSSVLGTKTEDLLAAPRLEAMKQQLASNTTSESLKASIRREDEQSRTRFFRSRAFLQHGGWLLIGGVAVLIASAKFVVDFSAKPYIPTGNAPAERAFDRRAKFVVAVSAIVVAAALLSLRLPTVRGISFASIKAESNAALVPTINSAKSQSATEAAWPGFRGRDNLAIAQGNYPLSWDSGTGKGIAWKTAVPLPGHGSPVVSGNRVFLTGGTEERREAWGFDANSGKLLWTTRVGASGSGGLLLPQDTGWAPSTPACDSQHVFAIFPTGELICLDLDGKPVWNKNLGPLKNQYGHACSLLTHGGLLYVQLDQGQAKDNLSAIYSFDCATGKQLWKVNRPVANSWSTPAIISTKSGEQLVTAAEPWTIAYDAKTGAELWRAKGISGEVVPSITFANDTLCVATEQSLLAMRVDGRGDVTGTHMKSLDAETLPDIVSPLAIDNRLLLASSGGTLAWVDAATGTTIWSKEFEGGFRASPIALGKRIYIIDHEGTTHVIEAADAFHELSASKLGQQVFATPAFADGKIFIRGVTDLFCVDGHSQGTSTAEAQR